MKILGQIFLKKHLLVVQQNINICKLYPRRFDEYHRSHRVKILIYYTVLNASTYSELSSKTQPSNKDKIDININKKDSLMSTYLSYQIQYIGTAAKLTAKSKNRKSMQS